MKWNGITWNWGDKFQVQKGVITVKILKAEVSSVGPSSEWIIYFLRSDEGLTLETSALKLFTIANLRYLELDDAAVLAWDWVGRKDVT